MIEKGHCLPILSMDRARDFITKNFLKREYFNYRKLKLNASYPIRFSEKSDLGGKNVLAISKKRSQFLHMFI